LIEITRKEVIRMPFGRGFSRWGGFGGGMGRVMGRGMGSGRGFGIGMGRGMERGVGFGPGMGMGRGNPYPFCRFNPSLPRRWWAYGSGYNPAPGAYRPSSYYNPTPGPW